MKAFTKLINIGGGTKIQKYDFFTTVKTSVYHQFCLCEITDDVTITWR